MSDYKLVLEHHGILGQKWGVRRFQNKDGSLTAEGKKRRNRYGAMDKTDDELKEFTRRRNLEKSYNRAMEFEEENPRNLQNVRNTVNDVRTATSATQNLVRNAPGRNKSNPRLDLSDKSDKELRDAINRELLERQYNQVFNAPQVSRGRVLAEQGLQTTGDVLAITAAGLGIAVSLKKLLG